MARHDSREERKKCSARATRSGTGADEGEDMRWGEGRDERPIPNQSRKNVRRPVELELVAMASQLRKKKLRRMSIRSAGVGRMNGTVELTPMLLHTRGERRLLPCCSRWPRWRSPECLRSLASYPCDGVYGSDDACACVQRRILGCAPTKLSMTRACSLPLVRDRPDEQEP